MTRTPRGVSLLGISLTVMALATGSWLSAVTPPAPEAQWAPDPVAERIHEMPVAPIKTSVLNRASC